MGSPVSIRSLVVAILGAASLMTSAGCFSDSQQSANDAREVAKEMPKPREGIPDDPPQEGGMSRGGDAEGTTPSKPGN